MSDVIVMDECPSRFDTTASGTPAAEHQRRLTVPQIVERTGRSPAATASSRNRPSGARGACTAAARVGRAEVQQDVAA